MQPSESAAGVVVEAGETMWFEKLMQRNRRRSTATRAFRAEATEVLEQRFLLSTVTLGAEHDNTIYDVLAGDVSNGAGEFIVAGGALGNAVARRGLVSFDVASAGIPAGSTILYVELSMHLAKSIGGSADVSVHKLLNAWGEAPRANGSEAPAKWYDGVAAQQFDATWLFSMFDGTAWSNAGGDFSGSSASISVDDSLGKKIWNDVGLIGDVQEWLDNPGLNHGWLIRGSETAGNLKGFDSRDSTNAVLRPTLEITYEEPVLPSIVEGRKFFDRNADGIRISTTVANLQLQFHQGKNYYNSFGGQEYWYRSQTNNSWYFVRPSGNLVKWDGQPRSLTGQTIESLDSRVWHKPSTLISDSAVAEPWLNGFTFELVNSVGTVVATSTSRDIDRNGDSIIQEETERGWYQFENVGPGKFSIREVAVSGWVQSASATSPLANTAYSLDSSLGLKFTGNYHENYGGRGERWMGATGGQWYYVTPIGELYHWNGAAASSSVLVQGTLVASLGASYYNDPTLIWAAVDPAVHVTAGTVVRGGDFGNYQPAVISGRKWHDLNPDGVRNKFVYDPSIPILLDPTFTPIAGSGDGPRFFVWVQDAATGNGTEVTYVLNPTTRVTRYTTPNSSSSGTTLVGSLPGIVVIDPRDPDDPYGTKAVSAYLFADEPWLNGWTFELLNERGFVVATTVSNDLDLNHNQTIEPEQERGWYSFEGLLPGKYTVREVQQPGWVQVSPAPVSLQSTLASLQTQYGFKPATNDSYNYGALKERWFQSRTNVWFYMTPNGGLFQWNQSSGGSSGPARGTKIAQLSGSVYLNPKLLFSPSPSDSTVTVVSGSVVDDRFFGNHNLLDGVFSSIAGLIQ